MFGITFAAAELTKNFRAAHYDGWAPRCMEDKQSSYPCTPCKRFDTALREWIAFNHPNFRRYT